MISRFWLILLFVSVVTSVLIVLFSFPPSVDKTLKVMTYSSFAGVFGPGELMRREFEKSCSCRIKWIKIPDSTLFVQRLSMKADGFNTDVVMGLDQFTLKEAQSLQWKKTFIVKNDWSPPVHDFVSPAFIPYNWSPMTFLSRKKLPKLKLKDLLSPKYKGEISLPSPRTSTVGLQFYYWVWFVFQQDSKEFLQKLKQQLYGFPPSWSTSYALFQRGHVDLSFSYLSSLLYHYQQNQEDFYLVEFEEGHPFQIEFAAVSSFCTQCELANQFVQFLLTPPIQDILLKRHYMLPVSSLKESNLLFQYLKQLPLISYNKLDLFLKQRDTLIE